MNEPENIAILLPNPVGDVVMATPALQALREHFSWGRITHVGSEVALEVLAGANLSDEQILDVSRQSPRLVNFFRQLKRIRRGRFDLAVLFPNSFNSFISCLCLSSSSHKIFQATIPFPRLL